MNKSRKKREKPVLNLFDFKDKLKRCHFVIFIWHLLRYK